MKKIKVFIVIVISITTLTYGFKDNNNNMKITAKEILGNKDYPAISYGGYRKISRDLQPTIDEIKDIDNTEIPIYLLEKALKIAGFDENG